MKKTIAIALVLVTLLSVTVLPFTASAGGWNYPVEYPIQYNSDEYLVSVADPVDSNFGTEYYIYSAEGKLIRTFTTSPWAKYPISDAVYTYDDTGKIVKETVKYFKDSSVSERQYNYGEGGRLISVRSSDGGSYERKYEYDAKGRLVKKSETDGVKSLVISYAYDGKGRLISEAVVQTGYDDLDIKYAYNSNGVLSTVDSLGLPDGCSYDYNGNLVRLGEVNYYKYVAKADLSKFRFNDVPDTFGFYDAVEWAAENGVTNGTSANTFSPFNECTRAQVMTFLWRAMGSPKPKTSEAPFTDVKKGSYYYDAVLWACENGITKGVSKTSFAPDRKITVPEALTFVWRAKGSPVVEYTGSYYRAIENEYYSNALRWAEMEDISDLSEMSEKYYPALRYNVAEYLWRAFGKKPVLSAEYRNNLSETFGKVNILPQAARWEAGKLIVDCYIVNGLDTTAKNISVESVLITNGKERVVERDDKTLLTGAVIKPHSYIKWTFTFEGSDVLVGNVDLYGLNFYATVTCDH